MIISKIKLENIRSHHKTEIPFEEGINVITGNTGSGKSSILMSVEYALFGKIGEGKEEGKMLLRRNSSEGEIKITIKNGNDEYEISRGLKRVNDSVRNDDSKNYINKNNERVDLQNRASDINSYVNKLLKIESENPLETFETITYIKQDELKTLIFETGQYKQEYIDGLLQLNKYLDVYDSTKEIINKIKNEIELDKKELQLSVDQNDIIKIENKINENQSKIKSLEEEATDNQILLNNKTIEKNQKESELEFERDKKIKFEKISTEIKIKESEKSKLELEKTRIIQKIEETQKNVKPIENSQKEEIEKAINDLEKQNKLEDENVKKLYEKFLQIEYSYKKAKNEVSELQKEIENENNILDKLNREQEELDKQIKSITEIENKEELAGRVYELNNLIKDLEKERSQSIEKGVCILCGNRITDQTHLEKEYSSKISRYKNEIERLTNIANSIKYSKNDLEKNIGLNKIRIETTKNGLLKLESKLKENKNEEREKEYLDIKETYEKEKQKLDKILLDLKNAREEMKLIQEQEKRMFEIESYKSRIDEIQGAISNYYLEITQLKENLSEIKFDDKRLNELENEFKLISEEVNKLNYRLTEIKKEIELRKSQLITDEHEREELERKIKKKEELSKMLDKKENFLKTMSNLREDIRGIREYVRLRFINDFKSLFKTRFEELRNEIDYAIDIDNNYNVVITAGNEKMDARSLSGGEKTSVAIAYRLALSSLASILGGVGKNEIIIMDEPTSGLDKEDINALTNAITKITDLKQIIIVTHEDNMKNIADNVIKLKKESGISSVY
ncbi:AAA family ATPase [Candidatus Parvarchaeota archaeon]|nr:AAA family ATPase [Candidatus Parvarchaeota archaeon]